ncbi:MAG: hypothetical protein ABR552_07995, partial [Actinomycetota bacterium]
MRIIDRRRARSDGKRARTAVPVAVVAGVLASLTVGLAAPAAAAPVSLSVSNMPQNVIVRPGASTTVSFTVRNPSSADQAVEILVTGLSVANGVYQFSGSPTRGLTVTPAPSRFSLKPRAAQDLMITLAAGRSVEPGGLYAGVIVKGTPPAQPGQGPVIGEIGVPLIARAAGSAIETGRIESFTYKDGTFTIGFRNTGNVHYDASGAITLSANGRGLGTLNVAGALVLPSTVRTYSARWDGALQKGAVRARLVMRWDGHSAARDLNFTIAPPAAAPRADEPAKSEGGAREWPWFLFLLAIPIFVLWKRRRDRDDDEPVQPAEQIVATVAGGTTAGVAVVPWRVGYA